jgi:hypothetical protein
MRSGGTASSRSTRSPRFYPWPAGAVVHCLMNRGWTDVQMAAVSAAGRRLEQAHQLWHRALDSYPSVDDFCLAVNNLLQTLRTVTFVLQKSLKHRDGFDAWYANRQREMNGDAVMKWAVEARNHIEKEGDLDLRSTARVSILASWLDAPYQELDIPPLIPPQAIAIALAPRDIPDKIRREGVFTVERRWVTASLPDHELLEACAHVCDVLRAVVSDAEATFGETEVRVQPGEPQRKRLDCMVAGRDARTARLHLQTGNFLAYTRAGMAPDPDDRERAAQHYGPALDAIPKPGNSLESRVRWYHQIGRVIVATDGHCTTVAFVYREGRLVTRIVLSPEDQQDKYLLMEHIADEVVTLGADEVIVSAEVWMAVARKGEPLGLVRAGDRDDRTEGFTTSGVNRAGEALMLITPFSTAGGKTGLDEINEDRTYPNLMLPIRRAWDR